MDNPQPPLPDKAQWYYLRAGETCGPIAATQLRHLVASGQIPAETLVWREGMRDWLSATELGLTNVAVAPVPPPITGREPRRAVRNHQSTASDTTAGNAAGTKERHRGARTSRLATARRWAWMLTAAVTLLIVGVAVGWVLQVSKGKLTAVAGMDALNAEHLSGQQVDDAVRALTSAVSELTPRTSEPSRHDTATPSAPATGRPDRNGRMGSITSPLRKPDIAAESPLTARAAEVTGASERAAPTRVTVSEPSAADMPGTPPVLFQLVTLHRRSSFGVAMKAMTQDVQYTILSQLNLQPRRSDGSFQVVQRVLDTRLDRSSDIVPGTHEKALAKLIGKQFIFTLNAKGEVTRFEGYESEHEVVPVAPAGGSGFQMVNVLDKDGWKEFVQLSFLQPAKHIAPGQNWTRQMGHDFSPLGSWAGTTTFSQDTEKPPPLLYYKYKHDMVYTKSETAGSALPFSTSDLTFRLVDASGTFVYDPARQFVTHVNELFHVKGTIGIEGMGALGSLEIDERQQTTIALTTQNPWAKR